MSRLNLFMLWRAFLFIVEIYVFVGFPLVMKNMSCQCRTCERRGFDPWVGKIPWQRTWQPTPVFLPRESHGQRSLMGYSPQGHKELDTTKANQHVLTHVDLCKIDPYNLLGNIMASPSLRSIHFMVNMNIFYNSRTIDGEVLMFGGRKREAQIP